MSILSDTSVTAAPVTSPLTDIPVVGTVVGWLDALLNDFGWSTVVNQVIELVLMSAALYAAGRWLLRRAVPWLATFLVKPAGGLVNGLRVVFLLPDLAVARTARMVNARPPALVYSYGDAVLNVADHVQAALGKGLPRLGVLSRRPGLLTAAVLVLAFLHWNTTYCAEQGGAACESPTARWVSSAKLMFEDAEDDADKDKKTSSDNKGQQKKG